MYKNSDIVPNVALFLQPFIDEKKGTIFKVIYYKALGQHIDQI